MAGSLPQVGGPGVFVRGVWTQIGSLVLGVGSSIFKRILEVGPKISYGFWERISALASTGLLTAESIYSVTCWKKSSPL